MFDFNVVFFFVCFNKAIDDVCALQVTVARRERLLHYVVEQRPLSKALAAHVHFLNNLLLSKVDRHDRLAPFASLSFSQLLQELN